MRVVIAADHRGYDLKQRLISFLRDPQFEPEIELEDLGTHGTKPVDYPDYAEAVGMAIAHGRAERGILICGSGVGVTVAANKIPGVRACMCHDTYSAHQGVEHDNMNVLVLGALVVDEEQARQLIRLFLSAHFDQIPRHALRVQKISVLEKTGCEGLFSKEAS